MTSHAPGFEDLLNRLLKLEKQNRQFKQLGLVGLIGVTLLLAMGQASSRKTVEANEFIVRDTSGNVRMKLAMDTKPDMPKIELFDAKGKRRVKLDTGSLPGLSLYDTEERRRGLFFMDDWLGRPALMLLHEDGKMGTRLRENDVFSSEVDTLQATSKEFILVDDNGKKRARLFVTAKNRTSMSIPGFAEPVPLTSNPRPMLALYDEKEQTKAFLEDSSLTFLNSQGHASAGLGNGMLMVVGDGDSGAVLAPGMAGVFDEQGFEATLGRRALVTPRTGETQMRSAASLVLFDKNKNVIWKAP